MRQVSIRVLVAAGVVAPIVAACAALVTLSSATCSRIAEALGAELVGGAVSSVGRELERYLGEAVRTSELYARRLDAGVLPGEGLGAWERPMLDDLLAGGSVASICYADARTGEATWLLRNRDRLEVGRSAGPGENQTVEFVVDPATGATVGGPLRVYAYDARGRPWYRAAIQAGGPVWTPVYFWFGAGGSDSETGTGFARPVVHADGTLRGVLVIDVTLGALSSYLRSLPISEAGHVFVIDREGLMVAASRGDVNGPTGERLALAQSSTGAGRALARAIAEGRLSAHDDGGGRLMIEGERARAVAVPLAPYPGIDWTVVAAVPERIFMSEVIATRHRSILVAGVASAGAVGLGLILARRLVDPLLRIRRHVRRVGAGDFESRLSLSAARELTEVSDALNEMTSGLRQRMELEQSLRLAMQVQQSLLPRRAPATPGLDLYGHSRYCDETGGDYFDFIEVHDVPGQSVVIAVGDVMGHGIAAALLMASARAALRVRAEADDSLAGLLSAVNRLLSRDCRHGRFMTMALLEIDAQQRRLRFASAGHDPPIVFDPSTGGFADLDLGDVPLGVLEDATFEEHSAELPPGALVLVGTDGIWEARNADHQQFGKDRLRELIRAHAAGGAQAVGEAIERAVGEWVGGGSPQDDVTYVAIRLSGPPRPGAGADAEPEEAGDPGDPREADAGVT